MPPASPAALFPRLLADIGGSNARFAWQAAPGAAPDHLRTLPAAEYAGPLEAATLYLHDLAATTGAGWQPPRAAALAVATAVGGDEVDFTNSGWRFRPAALRQALGLQRLLVLNDFEALALSLPGLRADQVRAAPGLGWQPPAVAPGTVLAVVGPGTGLGVGAVLRTRRGWQALPGEGGHATLAAGNALEAEVIAAARRRHGHVSAERLLSGSGLPLLHAALAAVQGRPAPAQDSAGDIVSAATDEGDAGALATLDLFFGWLGSFAGNVVLTLGARGGLYIGGGIVPRVAESFFASDFAARFVDKGRFSDYLAAVPVALVTDTLTALAGAAAALDDEDRE